MRDTWRSLRTDPPPPDPSFVDRDEDFHLTLSRSAGNAVCAEMLATINARIRPVRMYDFLTADRIDQTITQHLAVLEAVLAGRPDRAADVLQRHIGASLEVVHERAARAITHMLVYRGGLP